uniref:ketoacyl-ACP synthase III n=1 Tax=Paenibacillus sp. IHBB 10380 TaxID=1566358 RepID=UPI0011846FC4|nr:ketoacyl-ACP synthase III [Paenibacillus sp. IHBB 10380]
MLSISKARITAIGSYAPKHILTNSDLEALVETNDEWITQRTGVKERRIASKEEFTSDLCIQAVANLVHTYNQTIDDVDMIIVATTTSDFNFPSVACLVQDHFNIKGTGAMDLNATCAGFAYALHLANGLVTARLNRKVLVIAGETMSKVTDYTDRNTCILFGDGAGAVLVEYDEHDPSFISSHMGTNGGGGIHVYRSGLSEVMQGIPLQGCGNIVQNGREVYKWAVRTVTEGTTQLLEQSQTTWDNIDWFVPHSANLKMIESICAKVNFPFEKTLHSATYNGNTSSASIPLSLHTAVQQNKLKYGDQIIIYGFGSGLTHAGLLIKWGIKNLT